jgi:predicted phage tail protein
MSQDIVATIMLPSMFAWFAWVILSTIRRYKIAKLQAEVQTKLLEKVGSGQELLAYAQTETGRELLESLKVERVSPHGRIIGALQAGIILFFFGAALLLLRNTSAGGEGFAVAGALSCALGIGFALSAVSSYYLSKSFGLLNGPASHGPSHG